MPPILFSRATYPALSQYKFRDFAAGQRRAKLYPLWLHVVLFHADIEERVPGLVPCPWYVPVPALSARTMEWGAQVCSRNPSCFTDLASSHPAAQPPQQPVHTAHPKHHVKEVQANLPHTSLLAFATWQLGDYRSTSRNAGHFRIQEITFCRVLTLLSCISPMGLGRRPCTTQLCCKCSVFQSYRSKTLATLH